MACNLLVEQVESVVTQRKPTGLLPTCFLDLIALGVLPMSPLDKISLKTVESGER